MQLDTYQYATANGEWLSLSDRFALSLWTKVLDDSNGILVRNGQFSIQYNEDATLRGNVFTDNGWAETKTRLPSGQWFHLAFSYDGNLASLYVDGAKKSETSHNGYLSWGDGADRVLYLNRYGTQGMEGNAVFDDFRIYNRSLSENEVGLLWSQGAGNLGLSPRIVGNSIFSPETTSQQVFFLENNVPVVAGTLDANEINASIGVIQNFSSADLSYELNVSQIPSGVRISIPYGAVSRDGNFSAEGAFEFSRRMQTAVEEDLLAWYNLDNLSGNLIQDNSGRMRHANYAKIDATSPGDGSPNYSSSSSTYSGIRAFDNEKNSDGRWLARQSELPNIHIRYDFESPLVIGGYRIVNQSFQIETRSPKSWTL